MRVPHLSPIAYRRITIVAAVLLAIIIVTGGAVRLVGFRSRVPVVAELLDRSAHRARAVRLAPVDRVAQPDVHRPGVGGGDRRGARQPRAHPEAHGPRSGCRSGSSPACSRRRCSAGSPSVRPRSPAFVMAHFLAVDRAAHRTRSCSCAAPGSPTRPRTRRHAAHGHARTGAARARRAWCSSPARWSPAPGRTAAAASTTTCRGLDLRIPDVARVHGTMVMIFLGAVLVMVWLLRRDRAPHNVQHAGHVAARRPRRAGRGRLRRSTSTTSPRCSSACTSPARPRCGARRCALYLGDVRTHADRVARATRRSGVARARCLRLPEPACEAACGAVAVPLRSVLALRGDARASSGRRSRTPIATASGGRGSREFTRRRRRAPRLHHRRGGARSSSRRRCRTSCTAPCRSTKR